MISKRVKKLTGLRLSSNLRVGFCRVYQTNDSKWYYQNPKGEKIGPFQYGWEADSKWDVLGCMGGIPLSA